MENIIRFCVSLPKKLLDQLDKNILSKGYSSRSELVRDLIRETITDDKWQDENQDVVGVLTIVYDHHQRELNQKMNDIQHEAKACEVLCTTHVHIDHHNCLETIIIRGKPNEVEQMGLKIGGLKGVKFSKMTKTSSFE